MKSKQKYFAHFMAVGGAKRTRRKHGQSWKLTRYLHVLFNSFKNLPSSRSELLQPAYSSFPASSHHVAPSLRQRQRFWCSPSSRLRNIRSLGSLSRGSSLNAKRSRSSGIAELLIFHPVDTVAKRLMSNKAKVCRGVWPDSQRSRESHSTGIMGNSRAHPLQGTCVCTGRKEIPFTIPRSGICSRLQGCSTGI